MAGPFRPRLEALDERLVPSSVPLHVSGNRLLDAANKPVVLRGVNVGSLEWRPDGYKVMAEVNLAIDGWKANLIRLPLNQDFWFGTDTIWGGGKAGPGGATYRALVDQVVNACNAKGVYVLLDCHWSDMGTMGSQQAGYNQHYLPDDNSTKFWQSAAPRYANNPAVLFDPYNEPHFHKDSPTPADWKLWRDGGTVREDEDGNGWHFHGTYHSPGMQGLVNTIRATGARNVLTPEGLNWGANLAGVLTGSALTDPAGNLMYQTHLYPNKLADPAVAAAVDAVAAKHPVYVGEWASGGVPGKTSAAALKQNQDMLAYLAARPAVSWTAYSFTDGLSREYNLLASVETGTPTADFGAPVKAALAKPAPPAPAPFQVTARYDATPWTGGFTGSVSLVNTGTTAVSGGWTVEFDFTGNLYEAWNAVTVSHVGNHYVLRNASWNPTIGTGQTVSFGFNAFGNWLTDRPTNFVLNGVAIPRV